MSTALDQVEPLTVGVVITVYDGDSALTPLVKGLAKLHKPSKTPEGRIIRV